jgi:shikimate dehydrogenase
VRHRAAVLGSPIAHSLSPALHRAAYEALGLDFTYDAIEMTPDHLPAFLSSLDDAWIGLSLTMPLKESVQPLLSEIDEVALRTSAVNTVYRHDSGWAGSNTDVFGISTSLREVLPSEPRTARLLGAGATARSAVAAMSDLGVQSLVVCARRATQAQEIAQLARSFGIEADVCDLDPVPVREDLLISVLPGDAAAPWAASSISSQATLLDASYHPWPSALAAQWPNGKVASGRDMLLWQATRQVTLMTGLPAPVDSMRAAIAPI